MDRFLNILRAVGLVLAIANVAVQLRNNLRQGVFPSPMMTPVQEAPRDAFEAAFDRAQRAAQSGADPR